MGRLGALLGRFGALLEAFWAILGRYLGPLAPFCNVGKPKRRERQNLANAYRKSVMFASWGPGVLLEASWGRLGNALGRVEATLASSTDRSAFRSPLGPSWGPLGALLPRLGAFLGPGTPRGGMRIWVATPPGPPPGTPFPGGEGIKGKGLPFDSTTTLLNFALAGALEDDD